MKLLNTIALLVTTLDLAMAQDTMEVNAFNFSDFNPSPKNITAELVKLTPIEYQIHPEFGILPYNAPCKNCLELLQYRTDSTRMFVEIGSEGTQYYSQTSYGAINYLDENGFYRAYDPRLKDNEDMVYQALLQDMPMTLDLQNHITTFETTSGSKIEFNKNLTLIHVHADSSETNLGLANWSNYSVGENGILVYDVWPGIDMNIIFMQGCIKTNYTIKQNLGLSEGYLVFRDFIDGQNNELLYFADNAIPADGIHAKAGTLYFLNDEQEGVIIGKAFGYDHSGIRENSKNFGYSINVNEFNTWVPVNWLNNSNLVYPVIVDPTVTASTTYTAGVMRFRLNGSFCGGPNVDCSYTLNANRPANSTLTGATFSLVQTTIAGGCFFACWMADAGFYFQTTCGVDGYWGCNTNNPGTCTATNLDISPLVTCLAPACSGTIPFTIFNSYCYCNYGDICGVNCQSINNNSWIITLTGTTLETLGNTVTGNGSQTINDADCIGTSILNPLGSGGVPGYTYVWSTGATTPTITVNNTPAVYTVTVTDACGVARIATFNIGCPLPVRIDSFYIQQNINSVELNWRTKFEEGISHFIIERANLTGNFVSLSEIKSINNLYGSNYKFLDEFPLKGTSYYRLGIVYESGDIEYLEAIQVDFETEKLSIYPNPNQGGFQVKFSNSNKTSAELFLYDSQGVIVYQQNIEPTESNSFVNETWVDLNLQFLKAGVYTLKLIQDNVELTEKLVIQ